MLGTYAILWQKVLTFMPLHKAFLCKSICIVITLAISYFVFAETLTLNNPLFYILVIAGIFASACSQLLLKRSADRQHKSWLRSMLNWRVITAYSIFFCSLFINITAMSRGVNLKDLPILESLGYVFVPLLSN